MEKIVSYNVIGLDQGYQQSFKSIIDAYNYINELKKSDKKNNFKEKAYLIQIETDKAMYNYYKIVKYKNKYKLVFIENI